VLSIQGLTRPGIQPFSLDIEAGECVALTGPSGAGKTLLLRAIADLDPNRGSVFLDRVSRDDFIAPAWRRAVSYLAANSGWWADGVGVHFPDHDRAAALLPELGIAADALTWRVARLSTGERQRLAFARLALVSPRVMLLDEPTSGLDTEAVERVETMLGQRLAAGTTILLVTHAAEQARRLADRQLQMIDGSVTEAGA